MAVVSATTSRRAEVPTSDLGTVRSGAADGPSGMRVGAGHRTRHLGLSGGGHDLLAAMTSRSWASNHALRGRPPPYPVRSPPAPITR
jgi:hypothetical protein